MFRAVNRPRLAAPVLCAVLCAALTVAAPAAPAAQAATGLGQLSSASSNFGAMSSNAVNDAWRQGYNALPPQLRNAVPGQFRPSEPAPPATPPAPPAEPDRAAQPEPAPDTCATCVAITFDDGPDRETTRLLDILDQKSVKASFFVIGGKANANPATMRRLRDSGHTIGNHTASHPRLPRLTDAAIGQQLDGASNAITSTTGTSPQWMRPPYGEYDARVTAAARNRGQAVAMWDVDTLDWRHKDPERTCKVAVDGARPGSIVLLHDIHPTTVDAVPCIIDGLRAKGLRPVTLDQLIKNPQAGRVYERRP